MAAMITYGSYLDENENSKTALSVVIRDTVIALIAGVLFSDNIQLDQTPGQALG